MGKPGQSRQAKSGEKWEKGSKKKLQKKSAKMYSEVPYNCT
jgi:hypothetical protein